MLSELGLQLHFALRPSNCAARPWLLKATWDQQQVAGTFWYTRRVPLLIASGNDMSVISATPADGPRVQVAGLLPFQQSIQQLPASAKRHAKQRLRPKLQLIEPPSLVVHTALRGEGRRPCQCLSSPCRCCTKQQRAPLTPLAFTGPGLLLATKASSVAPRVSRRLEFTVLEINTEVAYQTKEACESEQ